MRRGGFRVFLALVASALLVTGSSLATEAAGSSRAAVVVDTGSAVYERVVSFDGPSISGIDALRLAGADPETVGYAGQGIAVCRLYGVGHDPSRSTCLGTPSDPRYWAYFRAPAGSEKFTYSSVGAGGSRVGNGDVEGWKFGTGEPPPFRSFCEIAGCPGGGVSGGTSEAAASEPPGTVGALSPGTAGGGGSPDTGGGGSGDGGVAGVGGVGSTGSPAVEAATGGEASGSATDISQTAAVAGQEMTSAVSPDGGDTAGGSEGGGTSGRRLGTLGSAAAFVVALGVIVFAGLLARRRRRPGF